MPPDQIGKRRRLHVEATQAVLAIRSIGDLMAGTEEDKELAVAMLEIIRKDAPRSLAMTDPYLYANLRAAITRYHLNGIAVR